jgi:hypothetical protein
MQTYLKIMTDTSPRGQSQPHEIIVLESGDSVVFEHNKVVVTRTKGELIARRVSTFAYLMNADGLTVSTYAAT